MPKFASNPRIIISLCIAVAIGAVYGQLYRADFINFDDPAYVTSNPHVSEGLSGEGLRWAFTESHSSNWHPLTWLSHMLDCTLFGLHAGRHHAVNVVIHALNAILLFLLLDRMTSRLLPSMVIAAVFAVHPLNVEPIAWISHRKDMLGAFFWLATTFFYTRYAESPSLRRYVLIVVAFAAGLLSKPMLVTLPFTLILLDYWPLSRLASGAPAEPRRFSVRPPGSLLLEKIPLLAMSAAVCAVTLFAQRGDGAVIAFADLGLPERTANAIVSYVRYIGKLIWPANLSVLYPHPDLSGGSALAAWQVWGATILLSAITIAVIRYRRRGYLVTGWFWFLGTLIPVIGLIQVGSQAMADRYVYLPMIGLLLIAVWGLNDLQRIARSLPRLALTLAVVAIWAFIMVAWAQAARWHNATTLYTYSLKVAPGSPALYYNLALAQEQSDAPEDALANYRRALRVHPEHVNAKMNLARLLILVGRPDEAEVVLRQAVANHPDHVTAYIHLGNLMISGRRLEEAEQHYRSALRLVPDHAGISINLANVLQMQGRLEEALEQLELAREQMPDSSVIHNSIGNCHMSLGHPEEAARHYRTAIRAAPDHFSSINNLGIALKKLGHWQAAAGAFERALALQPDYVHAQRNLAFVRERLTSGEPGSGNAN